MFAQVHADVGAWINSVCSSCATGWNKVDGSWDGRVAWAAAAAKRQEGDRVPARLPQLPPQPGGNAATCTRAWWMGSQPATEYPNSSWPASTEMLARWLPPPVLVSPSQLCAKMAGGDGHEGEAGPAAKCRKQVGGQTGLG